MHILPLGDIQLPDADEITHARGVGLPLFEKLVISFLTLPRKSQIKKLMTIGKIMKDIKVLILKNASGNYCQTKMKRGTFKKFWAL